MCLFDIFSSSYFALLCKSLLTITIAILITEMNCVFTDHDYFSCYKHDVSLCFLESRIIAVSANVFCWLYPTINKVYLILSYLILSMQYYWQNCTIMEYEMLYQIGLRVIYPNALNVQKTKFMIFHYRQRIITGNDIPRLMINNTLIEQVIVGCNLGVTWPLRA